MKKKKMKLYRFRSLGSGQDLKRAEEILTTGKFWCSRFWELNDPMEGVYTSERLYSSDFIDKTFEGKSEYVICSFSGERALTDPLMWCHYANGFRGIAIEVSVDVTDSNIRPVMYSADVPVSCDIKTILTTKLCAWSYENEYRYLEVGKPGLQSIREITAVYIGSPHMALVNKEKLEEKVESVRKYRNTRKNIINNIDNGITIHYAYLDGQYVKTRKLAPSERQQVVSGEN